MSYPKNPGPKQHIGFGSGPATPARVWRAQGLLAYMRKPREVKSVTVNRSMESLEDPHRIAEEVGF